MVSILGGSQGVYLPLNQEARAFATYSNPPPRKQGSFLGVNLAQYIYNFDDINASGNMYTLII